jgi:hypothetical protein
MTSSKPPITAERRAELEALAHELARQSAWDLALEDQAVPDSALAVVERELLEKALASKA